MDKIRTAAVCDICVMCTVFVLSLSPMISFSNTQLRTNTTTICENDNCTTTTCVNDEPCKTTSSNSTNITSFGGLSKNQIVITGNLPSKVI